MGGWRIGFLTLPPLNRVWYMEYECGIPTKIAKDARGQLLMGMSPAWARYFTVF
jgi:hypothetical protein